MMNPTFGASILSWTPPSWTAESGLYAIQQASAAGFDLLEILLPPSMAFDASSVKRQLRQYGLRATCALNLPPEAHIPFHPQEAIRLIKAAIDRASVLEVDYLGGVLHSGIGVFSGRQRTKADEDILCEVWAEVASYAAPSGITLGIEPINRYESYVCTSAEEVIRFIQRVGASNLALHLDTFHMNIEETSFYEPAINAGSRLRHVHMTERDRGMLGEGNVRWNDLFRGVAEIHFSGNLVLENFSNSVAGMAEAVSLWRPSKYNADELAKGSLAFMRRMTEKYASL